MKTFLLICAAGTLSACATVDPNYKLAIDAYTANATAQKASADAIAGAIEKIGTSSPDEGIKANAILALAMLRAGGNHAMIAPPVAPQSPTDKALAFVGAIAPLAVQGYGIWANKTMSIATARINADVSIERDRTNAAIFNAAGRANADIASTGFSAFTKGIDSIAGKLAQPITYNIGAGGVLASNSTITDTVVGSGRVKTNCDTRGGTAGNAGNASSSGGTATASGTSATPASAPASNGGLGGAGGQTNTAC
jgi:hypothetical protein